MFSTLGHRLLVLVLGLATCLSLTTAAEARPARGPAGPLTGELLVDNDRRGPLMVYIDGQRVGEVRPRQGRVFTGVLNGVRVVSWGSDGRFESEEIRVGVGQRAAIRVAPRFGTAVIRNQSGLDVRLSLEPDGHDAWRPRSRDRDLGNLRDGRQLETTPLPPGDYRLTATPTGRHKRLTPVTLRVRIVPGDARAITLEPYFARVTVENPFPHQVTVWINNTPGARIGPRQRLAVDDVLPGLVTLELRHQGQTLAEGAVELQPGQHFHWQARPAPIAPPRPPPAPAPRPRPGPPPR